MVARFDPAEFVRRLEEAGVPAAQAQAHLDVLRDTLLAGLANRQDIQSLIEESDGLRGAIADTNGRIDGLAEGLRADVEALRYDLDSRLSALTEAMSRRASARSGLAAWLLTFLGGVAVLAVGAVLGAMAQQIWPETLANWLR